MSEESYQRELERLYEPDLITSDSQREFNLVRDAVRDHYAPQGFIEHMYVSDLIDIEWERLRSSRLKTLIVAAARTTAVHTLLSLTMKDTDHKEIERLADRYFTNKDVRRQIERRFRSYGLTADNIDAEAFRQSLRSIERINHRLNELALRRDKIVSLLDDHRAGLAAPVGSVP